ncbi:hypothetical protein D3C81_2252570 [compost metagenome]
MRSWKGVIIGLKPFNAATILCAIGIATELVFSSSAIATECGRNRQALILRLSRNFIYNWAAGPRIGLLGMKFHI